MHLTSLKTEIKAAIVAATTEGQDLAPLAKKYVAFKQSDRGPNRITPEQWNQIAHEVAGVPYKPKKTKPQKENPPEHGPGTELHKLLTALGIEEWEGCGCGSILARMNALGIGGCGAGCYIVTKDGKASRHAGQLYKIAETIRSKAACVPSSKKRRAAWLVASRQPIGLALRLLWHGPCVGLVREAIRRAATSSASPVHQPTTCPVSSSVPAAH